MITDEIRHTAWDTFANCKSEFISDKLRAVLDAVEPLLIADYQQSLNVLGEAYDKKCEEVAKARAAAYLELADLCYEFENITGCPKLITQRDILDHAQAKHLTPDQQKALHRATRRGAQKVDPQYDPTIQPYDEPFRHKEELEQPGDPTNPFQRRDLAAQIKRAQELDPK